jgi:hypothetical protein
LVEIYTTWDGEEAAGRDVVLVDDLDGGHGGEAF